MSQSQTDSPLLHSPLANDPLLREMVQLFVEEMPDRAARLRKYFEACDWHALRRCLRQLNSAACSHGYDQLLPDLAEVESRLTRRAPTREVGEALERLLIRCERISAVPGA